MEKNTAWWDELGTPQYGGNLVIRANRNIISFDPYITENQANIYSAWMERLVADDWTLNPEIFDYKTHWHPAQYMKGNMAESWEFPDPGTHVIHLREGIHWQDIPPANGREFIADDVVFHYNRLCGLDGKSKPSSPPAPGLHDLISVTAADKYTVVFKFKTTNPDLIMEAIHKVYPSLCLENPDAVRKQGHLNDWHHAIKHAQLVHCPPGPLGHTASPFLELTRFREGPGNWAMVDDSVFNDFLPRAVAADSTDEIKQIIKNANERVARQHFTISLLQPMYYSLCQPWVKGFNAQHGSTWGHTGGPGMLSFYLGRFWIDRQLKQSMAH